MSAQQAFSTEFPLIREWGESKSFDVATGSTQSTCMSYLEFCLGRTLYMYMYMKVHGYVSTCVLYRIAGTDVILASINFGETALYWYWQN